MIQDPVVEMGPRRGAITAGRAVGARPGRAHPGRPRTGTGNFASRAVLSRPAGLANQQDAAPGGLPGLRGRTTGPHFVGPGARVEGRLPDPERAGRPRCARPRIRSWPRRAAPSGQEGGDAGGAAVFIPPRPLPARPRSAATGRRCGPADGLVGGRAAGGQKGESGGQRQWERESHPRPDAARVGRCHFSRNSRGRSQSAPRPSSVCPAAPARFPAAHWGLGVGDHTLH